MWKRFKRAVKSNLGRFGDDPTASSSSSRGQRKQALTDLSQNLEVVRNQIAMLESDLEKLESEEAALGARIKAALDSGDRPQALEQAEVLSRVRVNKQRISEQLARTRAVCARAQGLQHEVDMESRELAAAADATLERIERDLVGAGRIEGSPRKTVGEDSGPAPQAAKTIGGDGPAEKTIGGPSEYHGESTERTVIPKTIGGEVVEEAAPAGKSIGEEPEPAPAEATKAEPGGDLLDELERLASLLEKGILTPEEFAQAKKKLLGT